jgi:hypothetical protein
MKSKELIIENENDIDNYESKENSSSIEFNTIEKREYNL